LSVGGKGTHASGLALHEKLEGLCSRMTPKGNSPKVEGGRPSRTLEEKFPARKTCPTGRKVGVRLWGKQVQESQWEEVSNNCTSVEVLIIERMHG